MGIVLYLCETPDCTAIFFRTRDGCCARCGEPGRRVVYALRPPKPPEPG